MPIAHRSRTSQPKSVTRISCIASPPSTGGETGNKPERATAPKSRGLPTTPVMTSMSGQPPVEEGHRRSRRLLRAEFLSVDPANLLAVQGQVNQDKGDKQPAYLMPPNRAFHCQYAVQFIVV